VDEQEQTSEAAMAAKQVVSIVVGVLGLVTVAFLSAMAAGLL
jgi:hypothetical protein